MLSNNGSCLCARSCAVRVTIFSNGSIIPSGFKFMKLHALTLAARFYVLLVAFYELVFTHKIKNHEKRIVLHTLVASSTIAKKNFLFRL